jgi:hypothetical protein
MIERDGARGDQTMVIYMRLLGAVLVALGLVGSAVCWNAASDDEVYFKAARGLEKYPNNVLYQTEFKMAEPRHMLLLGGAFAAAPVGIVLGSLSLGVAAVLAQK